MKLNSWTSTYLEPKTKDLKDFFSSSSLEIGPDDLNILSFIFTFVGNSLSHKVPTITEHFRMEGSFKISASLTRHSEQTNSTADLAAQVLSNSVWNIYSDRWSKAALVNLFLFLFIGSNHMDWRIPVIKSPKDSLWEGDILKN